MHLVECINIIYMCMYHVSDISIRTPKLTLVVVADLPGVVIFVHTCIAIENLKEVKDALGYFSDWNNLGHNLGLHPDLLRKISKDKHSIDDRLEEVLHSWLQMECMDIEEEPTWNQLVAAVKPINRALSINIEKKYLI